MRKTLTVLLSCLLLFSLCACGDTKTETIQETEPVQEQDAIPEQDSAASQEAPATAQVYAIKYDVKINPEFTVYADESLTVTEISAENEDAENLLSSIDIVGQPVSEAFETIALEAKNQGYMTPEKGNTVDITILEKDEEEMPTCHVCGGCGTVVCKNCNGTGIACACARCNGTGNIHYDAGPACPVCGGSTACPDCSGTGKVVVTNGEDGGIVYIAEGVPEMGVCANCHGSGICGNCSGGNYSGEAIDLVCEGCNGTGQLRCNDDLNGYSWCPCCWGSGIDGTGDPNYSD